jgi:hypothetical protein
VLIDDVFAVFDVAERHETVIRAGRDPVYAAVRTLHLSNIPLVRALFLLRSLPAGLAGRAKGGQRLGLSMDDLLRGGFVLLEERPGEEILLGLVGRFWTLDGGIQRLSADEFHAFERPGYAKAAWNFHLSSGPAGATRLSTETRVRCTDPVSRRRFRVYWMLIGRFSGLTRVLMLRAVKQTAERSA